MLQGHGDDAYRYGRKMEINFSSNVYNAVDHTGLRRYLASRLEVMASYPEPEPYTLERELASRLEVPEASVCATNGATEAIYLIAQAFRGSRSAIVVPTFSEYEDACRLHGHRLEFLSAPEELPDGMQTFWCCNPNNPTGEARHPERFEKLLRKHPETLFVIDQSYGYFTLKPLFTVRRAAEFPNLVLLHSMTKRFAIPGLRLGYFTACPALAQRIREQRMPWSVNALAVEAGMYLLENGLPGGVEISSYLKECARVAREISRDGRFEVFPSDTHFMLVRILSGRGDAAALKDYLAREHGFLIRDASNFRGSDRNYFRIAAQTAAENNRLIAALRAWADPEKSE